MVYKFISKQEELKEVDRYLASIPIIFLDTESSLNKETNSYIDIVLLQVGDEKLQYIIHCPSVDVSKLRKYIEGSKLKVGHHLKYDAKILKYSFGWELNNIYDTMVVEQLIYCGLNTPKGFFSLEQTAYRYSGINPYSDQLSLFDPYIPKHLRLKANTSPEFIYYAGVDLVSTYRAYKAQQSIIKERKMEKLVKLECEYTLVLSDMEMVGVPISIPRWTYLDRWINRKLVKIEEQLQYLYPEVENWNSSKQVGKLFKELGMDILIKDKIKSVKLKMDVYKDSVQEIVISKFAKDYPIISLYLEYKKLQKLASTYGVSFLKHVNPITGRIHSSYFQILNTGRISSSKPNMQNVVTESDDFPEGKL